MSSVRRSFLGLHPRTVEAELAAQTAMHTALLESARRQVAALADERNTLSESLRRLLGRRAHLEGSVARMAVTAERDQRIAARAEERLQHELLTLEEAHRRHLSDLRREEASLRALLHRDEERFRALVARLRVALAIDGPAEGSTPFPIAQAAAAALEPSEES